MSRRRKFAVLYDVIRQPRSFFGDLSDGFCLICTLHWVGLGHTRAMEPESKRRYLIPADTRKRGSALPDIRAKIIYPATFIAFPGTSDPGKWRETLPFLYATMRLHRLHIGHGNL